MGSGEQQRDAPAEGWDAPSDGSGSLGGENSPRRVLIVDDDALLRDSLRDVFELAKLEVIEAGSAAEAFAAVESGRPDVVLLDVRLPDARGLGPLVKLLSLTRAPVIVMTGYASIRLQQDIFQLGAADFIEKPSEAEEILEIVFRGLERSDLGSVWPPKQVERAPSVAAIGGGGGVGRGLTFAAWMRQCRDQFWRTAFVRSDGDIAIAVRISGQSRTTVYREFFRLGLVRARTPHSGSG